MAILLAGFLLAAPLALQAQNDSSSEDVTALNQQVADLVKQGRFSEAIPLAQRVLAIRERAGADYPTRSAFPKFESYHAALSSM